MKLIFRANLTSYIFVGIGIFMGLCLSKNLDSCYFVSPADDVVRMCISSVHVHANSWCNIHLPLEKVSVIILKY